MGIESISVGAAYGNNAYSVEGTVTATPDGKVDGVTVRAKYGDERPPVRVPSTYQQPWQMPDGSTQQVTVPRVTAKNSTQQRPNDQRVSGGVTARFQSVSQGSVIVKPHASVSAGTNLNGDKAAGLQVGGTISTTGTQPTTLQVTGSLTNANGDVNSEITRFGLSPFKSKTPTGPLVTTPVDKFGADKLNEDAVNETLRLVKPRQ